MGLIRKVISGSAAIATGGASLGVVQFRSDTERVAHQVKLQRLQEQQQHEELMEMYSNQAAAMKAEREAASELNHSEVQQSAMSAPAVDPASRRHDSAPTVADRLADIERLAALRKSGVLTDAEYEVEKLAILRSI